jgi:hypothetical protein
MSATDRIKALAAVIPDPLRVLTDPELSDSEVARDMTLLNFWRLNLIIEDGGFRYYLDHGHYMEIVQLDHLLAGTNLPILREFWRLLHELTIMDEDFEGDDWLHDDLTLKYLDQTEDRFLQFNTEELCQALVEHLKL